jgi:hypothetical protein
MQGDEELHRNLVHNTTHLLLANTKPEQWIGNRTHGWVDEGVAHWFEERRTGKCLTYCYEEVAIHVEAFKGGRWKAPVRQFVEKGTLLPFAEVARLNTDQLGLQQRAQAFAYVDFLIDHYGGEAFMKMVRLLKQRAPTRDALRAAFGLGPLDFDQAFSAWVVEHYPLQDVSR